MMPLIFPAILAALPGVGRVLGNVFGGASRNRQEGRATQEQFDIQRDRNRILDQRNLLDQRQFAEQAPLERLSQAGRADMLQQLIPRLANAQARQEQVGDRTITRFGPDLSGLQASPETSQLADLVRERALAAQQQGDPVTPTPLSTPPQPTGFDRFLNIGAGVGAGLGAVDEILRKRGSNRDRQSGVLREGIRPNIRFSGR